MKQFIKWLFTGKIDIPKHGDSYIFVTDNPNKAKIYAHAEDLWSFVFEIKNNAWRKYKHSEPKTDFVTAYKELINDELESFGLSQIDEI